MRSSYKRIGPYIQLVDERNKGLKINTLLGLTIDKNFIPSVTNTIGTNMANYKITRKGQFACNLMQVRRDKKIPVALLKDFDEAIISQAYPVFKIVETEKLLPEYLMMWMSRSEFDLEAFFYAVGGVRGSLEWEDLCNMELPVPSIEKQREIVKEYHTIVDRIKLNEQLNQKLEETAQAIYKQWFVNFEFPVNSPPAEGWQAKPDGVVNSPPLEGCPTGRVVKRDTKAYRSLPYNPKLKDRAKALRKAGVLSEVLFWQQVHKKKFKGLDFDRQKIIGNYIVDFYCPNLNVVVEIDGSSHNDKQAYDAERDAYLKGLGLTVIHIKDIDVKRNLQGVMSMLSEHPSFKEKNCFARQSESDHFDVQGQGDHPALRAPLQRRGIGYKSGGGKMVWNEELGKEIPEGWEDGTLSDITYVIMGLSPKGDSYNTVGVGTPLVNGPVEFGKFFTKKSKWTSKPTKLSRKDDLIICVRGSTTGRFVISNDKYCLGRGVGALRARISQTFVNETYKILKDKMLTKTTGSIFPNWGGDLISDFLAILPPVEIVEQFETGYKSIRLYQKVNANVLDRLFDFKEILLSKEEKNGRPVRPVRGFDPDKFEQIQQELIGYCNLIQPSYFPRLSLEEIDDKSVLVIWVPAGSNRPYKVPDNVTSKHKTYNYRIRQYSSTIVPNSEQEAELVQLTAKIPFDDRVNSSAKVDDLSFGLMREHLAQTKSRLYSESAKMSIEELADAMNLSQGAKEHLFPKNVGLLMFAENPAQFFEGVQIDVVEFPNGLDGKEFNEKTFAGPIQKQLTGTLSYLKTNIIKSKVIKYDDREKADKVFNYPYPAIEEALANAVYHRNYELRDPIEVRVLPSKIEIISYNGIDPSLKQTDFEKGVVRTRRYRNRRIGGFLKELGLTEGKGTGIPIIYKAMEENGSPKPLFDTDAPNRSFFVVEFPIFPNFHEDDNDGGAIGGAIDLTERQNEILELIIINKKVAYREIAEILGINNSAVQAHIDTLKEKGILKRVGGTRGHWEVING